MRNLITAQEVIDLAFAENSNMMAESISDTAIRIAEIKYIRPAFGVMYPLLADKYADFTNDYVKPALAYFVKCEIVSSIAIDMSNSGVAVANPQYQSAATDKQRQRLYDSEMSKAKTLLDFALSYIAENKELFPDFSGEAPKKHHRLGGILLGSAGVSSGQSASITGDAFKAEFDKYIKEMSETAEEVKQLIDSTGAITEEAQKATNNANIATESANKATENANNAGAEAVRIATESAQEATTAKENAEQATEQAKVATANANEAADRANEEVDKLKEKADTDGSYPDMTVGKAENLVGRGEATEEYINFRQSAGEVSIEDGSAKITTIKGNSVVYNQQINHIIGNGTNGWLARQKDYIEQEGDTITLKYNPDAALFNNAMRHNVSINNGDWYYIEYGYESHNQNKHGNRVEITVADSGWYNKGLLTAKEVGVIGQVAHVGKVNASVENITSISVYFAPLADMTDEINDTPLKIWGFKFINLTKMFGAGNEPTTLEEYHQRKPIGVDTTVRNLGEILSNNVTAIKSVGENAYDYRVGYAKVLGGKTYNFEGTYTKIEFATTLDGTRETITLNENKQYTFKQEGYVFAEGSDICINIQHSYDKAFMHDYQQSVVDLSFIKTIKDSEGNLLFPNGLRAAGTAYDEIRYNATTKKWEAIKRIGVVDLGTLNWEKYSYTSTNTIFVCRALPNSSGSTQGLSTTYSRYSGALSSMSDMSFYMRPNDYPYYLYISDNRYTDATSFKQAVSGEKFLYILKEPITVELDTNFNPTYLVWDFGTEEAIASTPSAPFRADIVYQFNAVDRIRNNSDRIAELEAKIASLVQTMNAIQTTNLEE